MAMTGSAVLIKPLDVPLPASVDGNALTDEQWTTLLSIADTIIPSVGTDANESPEVLIVPSKQVEDFEYNVRIGNVVKDEKAISRFLDERPSTLPAFKALLARTVNIYLKEDDKKGLRILLSALKFVSMTSTAWQRYTDPYSTRVGCLVMTGYSTSFHLQPVHIRQKILQTWPRSYLSPLQQGAKAFNGLVQTIWARTSPTLGELIDYPRAPKHGSPGKGFDFSFVDFQEDDTPAVRETDVVIIGSGCGGAVCAKNLAEAGLKVLVCEKGHYWRPEYLPMKPEESTAHLFMNGGMITSDDASIAIVAGEAFGGGGTINWSASLQTQSYVRQEWADEGLTFFTSSEFQKSLDRVCDRMGVSTKHINQNTHNKILAEGARKLGYSHYDVPQNTGGKEHYCGYCTAGCGSAEKQGPVVSFLPDAARAGAEFMSGFHCERMNFSTVNGKKTATGVTGTWTPRAPSTANATTPTTQPPAFSRSVTVNAKRVIVSCGTMQSPLLLLRSGLTNPQIGRNLHLHPVTMLMAYHPHRPRFNPWEGGILTHVVTEFQNLDQKGHGSKIECMTMLPSWVLPFQSWVGGMEFKALAAKLPWLTCHIPIVRDRDTGRVYPDKKDGGLRVAYTPSEFDRKSCLEGLVGAAKIAFVEGAKEIWVPHTGVPVFVREERSEEEEEGGDGVNDKKFVEWVAKLRKRGLPLAEVGFGCAHQMGSNRMSATEAKGVVDPKGKVWGTEGLYVSDASVFPSASGVNPMVTNMGISDYISRGIARDLLAETGREMARL